MKGPGRKVKREMRASMSQREGGRLEKRKD